MGKLLLNVVPFYHYFSLEKSVFLQFYYPKLPSTFHVLSQVRIIGRMALEEMIFKFMFLLFFFFFAILLLPSFRLEFGSSYEDTWTPFPSLRLWPRFIDNGLVVIYVEKKIFICW